MLLRPASWVLAWSGAVAIAACTPSIGKLGLQDAGVDGPSSSALSCVPETAWVQANILIPACASGACHTVNDQIAGLDLASGDLVARLAGARALGCFGDTILRPGDPEGSLLYDKVLASPECGRRMPFEQALPDTDVACLRAWIAGLSVAPSDAGAPLDAPDGGAVGACPAGQMPCQGRCTNVASDNLNCGACGRTCAGGSVCSSGRCVCPEGQTLCGSTCVDVKTSAVHCGACSKVCSAGATCGGGVCVCGGGLTDCGGTCVDTKSSASHCGACGKPCGTGFICSAGACIRGACPRGTTNCGGGCVDTATSVLHCGACNQACAAGQACSGGTCSCGEGTTNCSGICVDTGSDASHCGGCGKACPAGSACAGGACGCGSLQPCGAACVDTDSDAANCGTCGKACANNETCKSGVCVVGCPPPTTLCGTACVDTSTDKNNCGTCGKICAAGESCTMGACTGCGPTVSFSARVQPIFDAKCTNMCHGGVRPSAGLNLLAGQSYAALVGVVAGGCNDGRLRVAAGDPARSYLMNKLTGQDMCSGTAMPARDQSLPAADLAAIRAWICQGAPRN